MIIKEKINTQDELSNSDLQVLFLTVMLDLIGYGILIPILPFWVTDVIGTTPFIYGLIISIYAGMQFIAAPFWGMLSDKHGRKPILLSGLFLSIIGFTIFFITAAFFVDSIILLFLSRIISGLGTGATLPTAQAYISDRTNKEERTKKFALIGAAFGLGLTLGPIFGSVFTFIGKSLVPSSLGYWAPGLFSAILAIVNFILAVKLLRESKLIHSQMRIQKGKKNNIKVLLSTKHLPVIVASIMSFSIMTLAMATIEPTFILYGEVQFNLDEITSGIALLVLGMVGIITQGFIVRPLSNRVKDGYLILVGLTSCGIGTFCLIYMTSLTDLLIFIVPISLGIFMTLPSSQSSLSKHIEEETQGLALGINKSFGSLMQITGPLLGTFLYEINEFFPFLSIVGFLFLGVLVTVFVLLRKE